MSHTVGAATANCVWDVNRWRARDPAGRHKLRHASLLFVFASMALIVTACEEGGGNLKFINETRTMVRVYTLGDQTGFSIAPGERTSVGTLISDWPNTVIATDDQGQQIFSKRYTWSDIDSVGLAILFTCSVGLAILFTCSSSTPTPTRAEVVAVHC